MTTPFLVVPHTDATDRLPLGHLLVAMALRPGLWHELKTFKVWDTALDRAERLERYASDVRTMIVGSTLYAKVVLDG